MMIRGRAAAGSPDSSACAGATAGQGEFPSVLPESRQHLHSTAGKELQTAAIFNLMSVLRVIFMCLNLRVANMTKMLLSNNT